MQIIVLRKLQSDPGCLETTIIGESPVDDETGLYKDVIILKNVVKYQLLTKNQLRQGPNGEAVPIKMNETILYIDDVFNGTNEIFHINQGAYEFAIATDEKTDFGKMYLSALENCKNTAEKMKAQQTAQQNQNKQLNEVISSLKKRKKSHK